MDTKDTITISRKEIAQLVKSGGKLVFKKSAEDELLKLLSLKDEIDNAVLQAKREIFEAGRSISPDFVGVIGSRLRASVRKYGDRYGFTDGVDPLYIKETITRRVNAGEVDKIREQTGKLPDGIVEREREEQLTISVPHKDHITIGQLPYTLNDQQVGGDTT